MQMSDVSKLARNGKTSSMCQELMQISKGYYHHSTGMMLSMDGIGERLSMLGTLITTPNS